MSQHYEDLQDPRPDETFDEARLAAFLADKLEGAEAPMRVKQFTGGMANLTYLLSFGSGKEYVYRRPPLGPYAPTAHDMSREYKALSVLHQAYAYAPRAWLYVEDSGVMGAPFLIMERRSGVVVRRRMPARFAAMPNAARQMSEALVDALVDFHAVDYAAIGLSDLGRPHGFVARQIAGWMRRWGAAKEADNPAVDQAHQWLEANLPETQRDSLVHNDFKLDNTMLAADDPSRLVAVFDWDMCTLGDPLLDLGTLQAYWTDPDDEPLLKTLSPLPPDASGFLTRRQLAERYALRSGRDIGDLRFYHVLGLFRWLVILQQIYIRYARGQTKDRRFADLHLGVALLAERALKISRC